jgi:hypothetical protein
MSNQSKQGILSYRMECEPTSGGLTGLSGLAPYLDLMCASGLVGSIDRNVSAAGEQGWTDTQSITSLVLLNLAGGECVDDLEHLEADEGLSKLVRWCENHTISRRVRRQMKKRWRKKRSRTIVSPSAARRYLSEFHDPKQEKLRVAGRAFIPGANDNLLSLRKVNAEFVAFAQSASKEVVATLDMDATLIETTKSEALFSYKHYRAYQPMQVYWFEQGMMLHSEFRDGNVPAGFEQKRVLVEALEFLPEGVVKVRVRSDTAGYQHELLKYCEKKQSERFGRIEFTISCDVTPEFKRAVEEVSEEDWHRLYREVNGKMVMTGREWAEVCFVPTPIAFGNKAPEYRYMATREALTNQPLPGMESEQMSLPFQTIVRGGVTYKVFGVVTNMDWEGGSLIRFHDGRCGKCEEAHKILKEDFAGGVMPSGEFGANAAWWAIAVLAMNIAAAMQRIVLGGGWAGRRMKAIRFLLMNVPGRVVSKARQLILRVCRDHPSLELLLRARERIRELACPASST